MFLTFTDNDNQTVKIIPAEIAMLQTQRMMVRAGGEETAYVETTGTRITLRSGREVWVNAGLAQIEALILPSMVSSSHTAFTQRVRGTGE